MIYSCYFASQVTPRLRLGKGWSGPLSPLFFIGFDACSCVFGFDFFFFVRGGRVLELSYICFSLFFFFFFAFLFFVCLFSFLFVVCLCVCVLSVRMGLRYGYAVGLCGVYIPTRTHRQNTHTHARAHTCR